MSDTGIGEKTLRGQLRRADLTLAGARTIMAAGRERASAAGGATDGRADR